MFGKESDSGTYLYVSFYVSQREYVDYGTLFYLVLDDHSSVRIRIETEESLETEEICVTPYAYVSLELYLAQLSSKVSYHIMLLKVRCKHVFDIDYKGTYGIRYYFRFSTQ